MRPKLLIFASGTSDGGGSGFENLVDAVRNGILDADIVGVVSSHEKGGVWKRAQLLDIRFGYISPELCGAREYQVVVNAFNPDFIALSGWMLKTKSLDPRITFNIHPAETMRFGGKGMYGDRVHRAVLEAYRRGQITHTAVSMHFVDSEYDTGPLIFQSDVAIEPNDTLRSLKKRVNAEEHFWQPRITNMILKGEVHWDGKNPSSLVGAMV